MKTNLRWLVLVVAIAASACTKEELDFDRLNNLQSKPNLQLPLVNARLQLDDLVETDSFLVEDPDKSLRIVYRQDSIVTFQPNNILELPSQDEVKYPLVVGQPPFDAGIALGTLAGAELADVNFSDGVLRFGVANAQPQPNDVDFELKIVNATNPVTGDTLTAQYTLPANQTSFRDSMSITPYTFDFSNNGQDINYIGIDARIVNDGGASNNTGFECFFQLDSMEISSAEGYFGDRVVNFPAGEFALDIQGLKEFSEGFFLTDPSIRLISRNEVGLPLEMSADFDGVNKQNNYAALNAPSLTLSTPQNAGDPAVLDTFRINSSNSNVVNFLASVPQKVIYTGSVQMNPNGRTGNTNFLATGAGVALDLEIDIPLELRAEKMQLEETIDDVNLTDENPEFIERLTMFFKSRSSFPFDVTMNVSFLDSVTRDSVAGISLDLLNAAPVNSQGRADPNNPVENVQQVVFDDDQINGLVRSNAIRIRATMNTANNGQEIVKLFTDYGLNLQIAVDTKLNADL